MKRYLEFLIFSCFITIIYCTTNIDYGIITFQQDSQVMDESQERTILFGDKPYPTIEVYDSPLSYDAGYDKICESVNKKTEISLEHRMYIEKHLGNSNVYLLLSTNLENLNKIYYTLMGMDLELVEKIYLVLNVKADDTTVALPTMLLAAFPKLIIFIGHEASISPLNKIIVPFNHFKELKDNDIFITITDDMAYPLTLVDTLVYGSLKNPTKTAIAISGFNFAKYTSNNQFLPVWPKQQSYKSMAGLPLFPVQLLEQFAGVVFRKTDINLELISEINNLDIPQCTESPDAILSLSLIKNRVNLVSLPSTFTSKIFAYKGLPQHLFEPKNAFAVNINNYYVCALSVKEKLLKK